MTTVRGSFAIFVAEWRSGLRSGWFIGLVAMPMVLFGLFGLGTPGNRGTMVTLLKVSFTCFGVVSLSVFAIGVDVADQRGTGWLRRLRVTPMSPVSFLAGKVLLGIAAAGTVLAGNVALAMVAGARPAAGDIALLALVLALGVLTLAPFGFALAFWARPRAAGVIGNLVFLPLSYCSGLMYPLRDLPGPVRALSLWLPTSHLGNLAWRCVADPTQLREFGVRGSGWPADIVILGGWACLATAVALAGWRRDEVRDRITG